MSNMSSQISFPNTRIEVFPKRTYFLHQEVHQRTQNRHAERLRRVNADSTSSGLARCRLGNLRCHDSRRGCNGRSLCDCLGRNGCAEHNAIDGRGAYGFGNDGSRGEGSTRDGSSVDDNGAELRGGDGTADASTCVLRGDAEGGSVGPVLLVSCVDVSAQVGAVEKVDAGVVVGFGVVIAGSQRAVRAVRELEVCGELVVADGDVERLDVDAVQRGEAAETRFLGASGHVALLEVDGLDGFEDVGVERRHAAGVEGGWVSACGTGRLARVAWVVVAGLCLESLDGGSRCGGSGCGERKGEVLESHVVRIQVVVPGTWVQVQRFMVILVAQRM
jgi:hypothetical protein